MFDVFSYGKLLKDLFKDAQSSLDVRVLLTILGDFCCELDPEHRPPWPEVIYTLRICKKQGHSSSES